MFCYEEEEAETKRLEHEYQRLTTGLVTEGQAEIAPHDDGSNMYIVVRSNETGRLYVERCINITVGDIEVVGFGRYPKVLPRTNYTLLRLHDDEVFGTLAECQAFARLQLREGE